MESDNFQSVSRPDFEIITIQIPDRTPIQTLDVIWPVKSSGYLQAIWAPSGGVHLASRAKPWPGTGSADGPWPGYGPAIDRPWLGHGPALGRPWLGHGPLGPTGPDWSGHGPRQTGQTAFRYPKP